MECHIEYPRRTSKRVEDKVTHVMRHVNCYRQYLVFTGEDIELLIKKATRKNKI